MGKEITNYGDRIAAPANLSDYGIDRRQWGTLVGAIFPSAQTPEAVLMAIQYCKQRNLDIFKRVVHIVPMYDSKLKREVETVWPGIAEIRTTAHRTGAYAGIDATEFGPEKVRDFKGTNRSGKSYSAKDVRYPEYAQITVYKMMGNTRCAFVGPKVFWTEICSGLGGTRVPNTRWQENPYQMLDKCAEAAALRRAFPEELGDTYAAEEMEGKTIDAGDVDGEPAETQVRKDPPRKQERETAEPAVDGGEQADSYEDRYMQNLASVSALPNFDVGLTILEKDRAAIGEELYDRLVAETESARATFCKANRVPDVIEFEIKGHLEENAADPVAIKNIHDAYRVEIENLPAKRRTAIEDLIDISLDEAARVSKDQPGDPDPEIEETDASEEGTTENE